MTGVEAGSSRRAAMAGREPMALRPRTIRCLRSSGSCMQSIDTNAPGEGSTS